MIRALVIGALLWSAHAAVPLDARAAACNRDNCYRDVFGVQTPGQSSSGTAACTSYLQKTVSPCPVSTTTTAIVTSTVATTTSTSTISSTTTSTTTTTTTVTASPMTVTVTSTPMKKRWVVEGRAVTSVCSPVTSSASSTKIPAYASDCTGTRFSSVCSCNGNVPTAIITLPTSTQTITITSTSSVTTSTIIITTFIATSTATITASTTTTSTVTVTAAPPQATVCTSAQVDACHAHGQGYFCAIEVGNGIPYCFLVSACPGTCTDNAQCTGSTGICAYHDPDLGFCANQPTLCVGDGFSE